MDREKGGVGERRREIKRREKGRNYCGKIGLDRKGDIEEGVGGERERVNCEGRNLFPCQNMSCLTSVNCQHERKKGRKRGGKR